jgi:predicted nuclease of predicted toxin-antitoxin system
MDRLAFLVDEHVDRAYVRALRSNGYSVGMPGDDYEAGMTDEAVLGVCHERGRVLVTNDRDFARLHHIHDHAGIVLYTEQTRTVGEVVGAIRGVDGQFSPDGIRDRLVWLDQWMR